MPPRAALLPSGPGRPAPPPAAGPGRRARTGGTTLQVVRVLPWQDDVVEATGIDPRTAYVEQFWLPVLGPSAVWLLRRIADRFDAEPAGFDLDLDRTARALGIGGLDARHAPLRRALRRCARFRLVQPRGPGEVAVRRAIGPLPQRLLDRLPEDLRAQHRHCEVAERPPAGDVPARRRARLLALDLAALGAPRPAVERRLLAWGVHPALAYESADWASDRPSLAPAPAPASAPYSSSRASRVRTPKPVPPFDR